MKPDDWYHWCVKIYVYRTTLWWTPFTLNFQMSVLSVNFLILVDPPKNHTFRLHKLPKRYSLMSYTGKLATYVTSIIICFTYFENTLNVWIFHNMLNKSLKSKLSYHNISNCFGYVEFDPKTIIFFFLNMNTFNESFSVKTKDSKDANQTNTSKMHFVNKQCMSDG